MTEQTIKPTNANTATVDLADTTFTATPTAEADAFADFSCSTSFTPSAADFAATATATTDFGALTDQPAESYAESRTSTEVTLYGAETIAVPKAGTLAVTVQGSGTFYCLTASEDVVPSLSGGLVDQSYTVNWTMPSEDLVHEMGISVDLPEQVDVGVTAALPTQDELAQDLAEGASYRGHDPERVSIMRIGKDPETGKQRVVSWRTAPASALREIGV
jgi:hypothetical protein